MGEYDESASIAEQDKVFRFQRIPCVTQNPRCLGRKNWFGVILGSVLLDDHVMGESGCKAAK